MGDTCCWAAWKGDLSKEQNLAVLEAPAKVSDGGFLEGRQLRKSRPGKNSLCQALLF